MEKYKTKYRVDTARLKNWDYGSHGWYFVTICTQGKECYFGEIEFDPVITNNNALSQNFVPTDNVETQNFASLRPTEIGRVAHQNWLEIPNHFPFIKLDEFVVMPNHVHGILFINKPDYHDWKPNTFGPQSQNLASVIRGYKASVKKYATMNQIEFAWQPRYHDHIIRYYQNLHMIRHYIWDNPLKWATNADQNQSLTQIVKNG